MAARTLAWEVVHTVAVRKVEASVHMAVELAHRVAAAELVRLVVVANIVRYILRMQVGVAADSDRCSSEYLSSSVFARVYTFFDTHLV